MEVCNNDVTNIKDEIPWVKFDATSTDQLRVTGHAQSGSKRTTLVTLHWLQEPYFSLKMFPYITFDSVPSALPLSSIINT